MFGQKTRSCPFARVRESSLLEIFEPKLMHLCFPLLGSHPRSRPRSVSPSVFFHSSLAICFPSLTSISFLELLQLKVRESKEELEEARQHWDPREGRYAYPSLSPSSLSLAFPKLWLNTKDRRKNLPFSLPQKHPMDRLPWPGKVTDPLLHSPLGEKMDAMTGHSLYAPPYPHLPMTQAPTSNNRKMEIHHHFPTRDLSVTSYST